MKGNESFSGNTLVNNSVSDFHEQFLVCVYNKKFIILDEIVVIQSISR
jgi:hypothetical protein